MKFYLRLLYYHVLLELRDQNGGTLWQKVKVSLDQFFSQYKFAIMVLPVMSPTVRGGLKKTLIFGLLAQTRGEAGVSGGPKGPILLTGFFQKLVK